MNNEPVAWMIIDVDNGKSLQFKENKFSEINIPLYTAPKELSDEELNKAFDYYCETDEGVLRFNYELRDEWKKEQLIRWKEAFKKAKWEMNAYELAEDLENSNGLQYITKVGLVSLSAKMLRQQAEKISNMEIWEKKYLDRIEELEKEKIRAYDNGYEDGRKPNTENNK